MDGTNQLMYARWLLPTDSTACVLKSVNIADAVS